MEGSGTWQGLILVSIMTWICLSSYLRLTHKFRSLVQPWVARQVVGGVPLILEIQKHQNGVIDAFFSGLSCVVSVPFYTAFLPLLFWSGHGRLARQMTLLIAFCDYLGNCIKDVGVKKLDTLQDSDRCVSQHNKHLVNKSSKLCGRTYTKRSREGVCLWITTLHRTCL